MRPSPDGVAMGVPGRSAAPAPARILRLRPQCTTEREQVGICHDRGTCWPRSPGAHAGPQQPSGRRLLADELADIEEEVDDLIDDNDQG